MATKKQLDALKKGREARAKKTKITKTSTPKKTVAKKTNNQSKINEIRINDTTSQGILMKSSIAKGEYIYHFRTFGKYNSCDLKKIKKSIPKSIDLSKVYLISNGEGVGYISKL